MWQWIKVPKAVALLAFFLPWVTVSCANQRLAQGSGVDLVQGKLVPLMGAMAEKTAPDDNFEINYLLAAAAAVILLGLLVSFLPRRLGALLALATAIGGLVLTWLGTNRFAQQLYARVAERGDTRGTALGGSDSPFGKDGPDMAALIQVQWEPGYWITMAALVAAAVMALLVVSGRDARLAADADEPLPPPAA